MLKHSLLPSQFQYKRVNEYNAAMYFYSAEQRNAYYKGDVDDAVLEVELELESGFTANTHAYIIVYRECKIN